MSILKGILHHWNKTNSAYDTIHPETESAQITDWHSGIMASLASKTLGTVVDAVTTDSVLGKLIKMLLNASGVKYLMDTNGYICFGEYFGGLIIQWGNTAVGQKTNITWNIVFPSECWQVVGTPDTPDIAEYITEVGGITNSGCFFSAMYPNGNIGSRLIRWICVGH